jgi:hypothetical protein
VAVQRRLAALPHGPRLVTANADVIRAGASCKRLGAAHDHRATVDRHFVVGPKESSMDTRLIEEVATWAR